MRLSDEIWIWYGVSVVEIKAEKFSKSRSIKQNKFFSFGPAFLCLQNKLKTEFDYHVMFIRWWTNEEDKPWRFKV